MQQLKIVTWNLGYGAMGAGADIAFEGGKHFIPSPSAVVKENIAGIQQTLRDLQADAYILQELSTGSLLNHWQNVRKAVDDVLSKHARTRVSNFSLPLFLDTLRNEHGLGTYVNDQCKIHRRAKKLFGHGEWYYHIVPRWDYALATFTTTRSGKRLAFVNTHLASFNGAIRTSQFDELMTFVQKIAKKGYAVIVGADWNMHTRTMHFNFNKDEDDDYIRGEFPHGALPKGWHAHFPLNAPTSRAVNRPYTPGETTTAFIDGFICSDDVRVEDVTTLDLGFAHSDHNPVKLTVSL